MMDEEGNQFVAYFLPNEETIRKRKRDVDEELDYMPDDLWVIQQAFTHLSRQDTNNSTDMLTILSQ